VWSGKCTEKKRINPCSVTVFYFDKNQNWPSFISISKKIAVVVMVM
jgi:hypothetical protein